MKLKINSAFVLSLAFVAMLGYSANAQTHYTSNAIGLKFGTTSSFTDVRAHDYYRSFNYNGKSEYKPFVGLTGLHMFSHVFGIYADVAMGTVQGVLGDRNKRGSKYDYISDDYALYQRLGFSKAIYSKTNFLDASVNLYINISNLGWFTKMANNKNAKMRRWGIYSYAGVGMGTFYGKVYALNSSNQAQIDKESFYMHGFSAAKKKFYGSDDLVFPVALGFKYHLSNAIDLGLEASMRFTNTDKFDGVADQVAKTYDAKFLATVTKTNNTALTESRYQAYANDKYALVGLTVAYKLGSNKVSNKNIEWNDPQEAILKNVDAEMGKLRSLLNDSDKDGVSDAFDKEPNTPANVKVDGSGTALDVDGDGVADYKDEEPFSPKGSTVNENGIAADADNDGVADVRDLEPNTKPNALVNFRGVTIGSRDAAVTNSSKEDKPLVMFPAIYFDVNSSVIRSQYYDLLTDAARNLMQNKDIKINIYGNCDVRGDDALNNDLGRRRANAVADYLRKNYNIEASRIKIVETLGKSHPISNQHRPNRRVDILLAE